MKNLSEENEKIISKLHHISSLIFKQYSILINNEIDGKNDEATTKGIIDKILMFIELENQLLDNHINIDNCEDILKAIDYEEEYVKNQIQTNSPDGFRLIIIKRIYTNLLMKYISLNNMIEKAHEKMLIDSSTLYFVRILEEEANMNPNYRKELIRKKYFLFAANPVIENLAIPHNFIANIDYSDFVNSINDRNFQKHERSKIGKKIIEKNIKLAEELTDPKDITATIQGMCLRASFLLVDDYRAHEIILNYLKELGIEESEYSENHKIIIDAYRESKSDRYKYIPKSIFSSQYLMKQREEKRILDELIKKARNILKLYKKLIEIKTSQPEDKNEIKKYIDLIQILVEGEFKFYQETLSKKEKVFIEDMYFKFYKRIFDNNMTGIIDRFNGLLMNEDTYPELRVLSLLDSFVNKDRDYITCTELISLIYLMRLVEKQDDDKDLSIYKKHMISYLNPEIENLTLCTNFSGNNNYPDQIYTDFNSDQSFKNTVAFDMIKTMINEILNYSYNEKSKLLIRGLYLQSVLMLASDYIIAKVKRDLICLQNSMREKIIVQSNKHSNKTKNYLLEKKEEELFKKECLVKYILVLVNESRKQRDNLEIIKTYEKELNRLN